jgi:hypothetical protein
MYFFEYFESKIHEADINTIIFLLIKLIFDILVTYFIYSTMSGIIIGAIIFVVSILYAFSDAGESLFRNKLGKSKKINNKRFKRLLLKAMSISEFDIDYQKINFFLVDNNKNYLYATSRHSICLTNKFLLNSDSEILTQLLRELKHINDFDADDTLYVGVGDFYIDSFVWIIKIGFYLLSIVMRLVDIIINKIQHDNKSKLSNVVFNFGNKFTNGITNLWLNIGILLILKSNRTKEYESDEFVCQFGYTKELIDLIDKGCYRNNIDIFESNLKNKNLRLKKIDNY